MKKLFVLLIILIFTVCSHSIGQKKWQWGVGVEGSINRLQHFNPNIEHASGQLSRYYNQRSTPTISPYFFVKRRVFNPNWHFITGIGYSYNKHYFDFKLEQRPDNSAIDTFLSISYKYLQFPFLLQRTVKCFKNNNLNVSGGVKVNVLLNGEDDFEGLSTGVPYMIYGYSFLNILPSCGLSYSHQIKNGGVFNIEGFVNYELIPQTTGLNWGFFKHLEKARNLQIGIGLSYMF